jgi:hypothetical protein
MVILAVAVAIVGGVFILGAVLPANAKAEQDKPENNLVGTWRVQVTTFNCVSGVKAPSFKSMLSFASGGTLIGTTANPAFQPGQLSVGLGIWNDSSKNTFQAVSEAYILFATPANPPAPGLMRGTQRITQTIQVNGDQLTSNATVQFFDESGKELVKGCASATGERVK